MSTPNRIAPSTLLSRVERATTLSSHAVDDVLRRLADDDIAEARLRLVDAISLLELAGCFLDDAQGDT
jgi:hypothetical protein